MLIVLTGNGKGKTTSALGQAMRVIGEGGKVIMLQFIKGPWKSGEDKTWKRLRPDFKIIKGGKGFVGILEDLLPRSVHVKTAEDTWKKAKKYIESGKYNLVILDELNVALKLRLLSLKNILPTLKKHKYNIDIMVTGREASNQMIKIADLVSEVKEIKHPFNKGGKARKGIEF